MSVYGYIPVALVKAWIQPLSSAIGFDQYGHQIIPKNFSCSFDSTFPSLITAVASFGYPVMSVQMFSYYGGLYSQPIIVDLDYPSTLVMLVMSIMP